MHIDERQAQAANIVGAWGLAVADAIEHATVAIVGIAGAAPAALVAVAADPDLCIDELRRALGLTHPGTVRLVDRLEGCGWIARRPGRGRTVHLRLTEQGRRTHRDLLDARQRAIVALAASLEPGTLEHVAQLIAPSLTAAATNTDQLRHICRLCRRSDCEPCPATAGLDDHQPGSVLCAG